MKKIVLFLLAMILCCCANAQNQIACLIHEGGMINYYGIDALINAHNAATDGDVITLSPGTFKSVDITKLITIRGAGMGVKANVNDVLFEPTILVGDFSVTADGNETSHFALENIRTDSKMDLRGTNYTQFLKCVFSEVKYTANYGLLGNCSFIHCHVTKSFSGLYNITFSAQNSHFKNPYFRGNSSLFTLNNCIIETENPESYLSESSMNNCIIIYTGTNTGAYASCSSIYNTLWAGIGREIPFSVYEGHNNYKISSYENLFIEGSFYQLTEEIKQYKGSDGKELGIYGGTIPFTCRTNVPQISKFEVSPESTKEGKLGVNIVVE